MTEESVFDAVIVGSGLNSMVAGALLARAKWRVAVLERNDAELNCQTFGALAKGDGEGWRPILEEGAKRAEIVGRLLGTELWSRAGLSLALRAFRDMHSHGLVELAGPRPRRSP